MLILPAHAHADLERVKTMLHAQFARQAREVEFQSVFPDCEVGAMPPFGNLYDVPVHLDHSLARVPYLVFEAGSHRSAMKILTSDYLRLVLPTIGDFTEQARLAPAEA